MPSGSNDYLPKIGGDVSPATVSEKIQVHTDVWREPSLLVSDARMSSNQPVIAPKREIGSSLCDLRADCACDLFEGTVRIHP